MPFSIVNWSLIIINFFIFSILVKFLFFFFFFFFIKEQMCCFHSLFASSRQIMWVIHSANSINDQLVYIFKTASSSFVRVHSSFIFYFYTSICMYILTHSIVTLSWPKKHWCMTRNNRLRASLTLRVRNGAGAYHVPLTADAVFCLVFCWCVYAQTLVRASQPRTKRVSICRRSAPTITF